jgi:GntR family transcriptional regulator, transcriptional repressor for pyruvate dehydrogenase complex
MMTGRVQSVKGMSRASLSVTQPLPAPRSLTGELVARLTDDITSGKIPPGSRLPTEQELIAATGVSRTVVREAVAALRANGLVVTRQGVGAFVPENARRPLRIDVDPLSPLELRTGIEIEAAGLAADRGSASQIRRIVECFDSVGAALKRGEDAIAQDFALHCSIADATGNPQFRRFLEHLGRVIIPRQTIRGGPGIAKRAYSETFQREHRAIVQAIRNGPSCKRARRCAGISSTAASAISGSPPSSAVASTHSFVVDTQQRRAFGARVCRSD